MRIKLAFDFRYVMAVICVSVFTFCLLKYFEPAEAIKFQITNTLSIPSIGLDTGVSKVNLVDGALETPDKIVGSYSRHDNSTLLFGHSSTVFSDLQNIKIGDEIIYDGRIYNIYMTHITEKSSINMKELLAEKEQDTLILMTCFGEMYSNGDASHRLIIFASRV